MDFDADKFYLGTLCKRGHDYDGTGMSLRYRSCNRCYRCHCEYNVENAQRIKEYRKKNADKIRERKRQYREKNADKIREYERQYYQKNADKIREYARRYHKENADAFKEYMSQYRLKNADKLREQYKVYCENNPEKFREKHRRYRENNPEKIKENYRKSRSARIARQRRKSAFENGCIIPQSVYEQKSAYFDNSCCYCQKPFTEINHVTWDHFIPLSKGGEHRSDNLLPCCHSCNSSKNAKEPFQYLSKLGLSESRIAFILSGLELE